MKAMLSVMILLASTAAWAQPNSIKEQAAAITAFKASPAVHSELKDLGAKTKGQPTAILVSGMGDGFDFMASYLVVQSLQPNDAFRNAIAGLVDVETRDLTESGEGKGYKYSASFNRLVDLAQVRD